MSIAESILSDDMSLREPGRIEVAEDIFNSLLEENPDLPVARIGLARCATQATNWTLAETRWRGVAEQFPHIVLAREGLAKALRAQWRFDTAEILYSMLVEEHPDRPAGFIGLAQCAAVVADWPLAETRWQAVADRFPAHAAVLHGRANTLLAQKRVKAAEVLYNKLVEEHPDLPAGYVGLSRCAAETEDWFLAETRWRDVVKQFPYHFVAAAQVGETLRKQRRFNEAEAAFCKVVDQYPERPHGYTGVARCASAKADWPLAETHWRTVVEKFPQFLAGRQGLGNSLREQGCFDEATEMFQHIKREFPYHPHGSIGLAKMATANRDTGTALGIWRQLAAQFPNHLDIRLGELTALFEHNDRDEANALLTMLLDRFNRLEAEIWQTYLNATDSYGIAFGEIESVYQKIVRLTQPSIKVLGIYAKALWRAGRAEEAIALIEDELRRCDTQFDNRAIKLKCTLADNLLCDNRLDEASAVVDGLCALPHMNGHPKVSDLAMWKSSHDGDIDTAKRRCFDSPHILKRLQISVSRSNLELIRRPHRARVSSGSVILFARLRNQMVVIEKFLEHYRNIGVDQFVFVDNGSDDGTFELLRECSDSYLYHTLDSYAQAGSGVAWMNQLIERHTEQVHWCLFADLDEFLVAPDSENLGIRQLVEYNEKHGFEAVGGFMLDMYPGSFSDWDNDDTTHFIDSSSYFDNTYRFSSITKAPYVLPYGGVRQRLFPGFRAYLVKAPMIRGGGGIKYLSSHNISPCSVSDVSTAFLHYKIAPDFEERASEELERKQYWNGGAQWKKGLQYMADLRQADSLLSEHSVKYKSSRQLVDLGLIRCPDRY